MPVTQRNWPEPSAPGSSTLSRDIGRITHENATTTLRKIDCDRVEVAMIAKSIEDYSRDSEERNEGVELDSVGDEGVEECVCSRGWGTIHPKSSEC